MHPKWKTNDEFPGSISLPFGVKTSHTWHEVGQILRIINDYNVNTFVELGCHVGGLASVVGCRHAFYPEFKYIGYEYNEAIIDNTVKEKFDIRVGDIFENSAGMIKSISGFGRMFIYCDNGNKVLEMEIFSKQLSSGDIIACHDYYDEQEVFGLKNFGKSEECGCVPEVWKKDVQYLFDDLNFDVLPSYLLEGTRIIGFIKK